MSYVSIVVSFIPNCYNQNPLDRTKKIIQRVRAYISEMEKGKFAGKCYVRIIEHSNNECSDKRDSTVSSLARISQKNIRSGVAKLIVRPSSVAVCRINFKKVIT